MTKVVKAKYDAREKTLRLVEPLEGVRDHETVDVQVTARVDEPTEEPKRGSMALAGIISDEDGEELSRAVNEMFPPWDGTTD